MHNHIIPPYLRCPNLNCVESVLVSRKVCVTGQDLSWREARQLSGPGKWISLLGG